MTHNDEPLIDTKTELPKDDDHFIIQPSTDDEQLVQGGGNIQTIQRQRNPIFPKNSQCPEDFRPPALETSVVDNGQLEHGVNKPTVYAGLWAAMIPPDKQENVTVETTQPEPADEAKKNQQQHSFDEPQADEKMENQPEEEDDDEGTLFVGEPTIRELIKKGNDIFLVVGVAGSGKTQLLEAFDRHIQKGAISVFKSSEDGRVKGTAPGTLNFLSLNSNAIFIDASGENFSGLYPGDKSITQKDLKIPKLVKPKLRGLILVIELEAYWTDDAYSKKMQIQIVTWILVIFRWLFNGGVYPEDTTLTLEQYINHSVNKMKGAKTRLNIPVQVLFSKADILHGFPVHGSKERLFPSEDSPFFLAYHYLPEIHHALLKHTNYFRYDFAHSIVTDSETDDTKEADVLEKEPCGVELSFQWLFNHQGKGSPRTEELIEQQKKIDKRLFWRPSRWKKKSIVKA